MFFVDEIHRLPRAVEETFYPAMEDRQLPITVGAGAGARVVTLDLPPFTLIGATTRAGLLTTPLRDRFGIQHRLEHYEPDDLARIVRRSAGVLDVEIDDGGRAGDRRALARHAARRQPPAQARARLRRGARRRRDRRRRPPRRRSTCSRSTTSGLDRLDREILTRHLRAASAAARSGSRRSRSRWARSPTRSRTSTSPICSSAASSSARRAGAARPTRAFRHLGLEPPPAEAASLF